MKTFFLRFGLLVAGCFLLMQCVHDDAQAVSSIDENDRRLLEEFGYDTDGMVEYEQYYVLKPDLIVSKERLEEMRNDPQTRMQQDPSYGLVNEENQTIYIMDQYADVMTEALRGAVEEYNKLHSNLRFVIDNSHYNAVHIGCGDDGPGINPISVERPGRVGEYGKFARVNYTSYRRWATDYTEGKYAMMHVLGHLAGFNHAVTELVTSPQPGWIPGTDYADRESIMRTEKHIVDGIWSWTGFSEPDRLTIEQKFPYKEPEATFRLTCDPDDGNLDMRKKYLFEVVAQNVNDEVPQYGYTVTRIDSGTADYTLTRNGANRFYLTFNKSGKYRITVNVTNISKPTSFYEDYMVYTPDPQLTVPASVTLGQPCEIKVRIYNAGANPTYSVKVESEGNYSVVSKEKNRFLIRFDSEEVYNVTVSRPLSYAQSAKCKVVISRRPYYQLLNFSHPGGPLRNFLSFYQDQALTTPYPQNSYVRYNLNLFYRSRRSADGSIVNANMTKPVETRECIAGFSRPTMDIRLPERRQDTTIIRRLDQDDIIVPVDFKIEYFGPYYTVTYPENRIEVQNPTE